MATVKKAITRKFVVVKKHTLDYKIGETVELTAREAKALIGKVRPLADVERDAKTGDEVKSLAEANAALGKENAELKAKLAELEKASN